MPYPDMPQTLETRFAILFFTDIVGSTDLKARYGVPAYSHALCLHNQLFEQLSGQCQIKILHNMGDGYFAEASSVTDAVRFALLFQHAMRTAPWREITLETRVGINAGEISAIPSEGGSGIVAPAADLAARVMSLAFGGQILLTRLPFDEARYFLREHPPLDGQAVPELRWMAHGPYLLKGRDEPMDIFEVGADGLAPLAPPMDTEKAKRAIRPGEEETLGWRPAIGLEIPSRPNWRLIKRLGTGGFGEVWAGEHSTLKQQRAFKFCFDDQRLRALKREVTLVRLLRTALGERDDIVRFHELKLDEPPFYLESDLAPHGNLLQWAEKKGGLAAIPLTQRIRFVIDTATALAAAHSVGVLHKDIKPTNILIFDARDGSPRARLVDFGIGTVAEAGILAKHGVTAAGFTRATIEHSTGTPTYSPPESLAGKPYTMQGDIYGLGVLLFQMLVADATRPLAPGWERDIPDPLLREDIAHCVDGDPARRFPSAADLAHRLQRLEQRRAEIAERERLLREAAALKEAEAAAASARARSRQLLNLAVVFCVLAVLAAGGGILAWIQKRKADAANIRTVAAERLQRELREDAELHAYAADMYLGVQLGSVPGSLVGPAKSLERWRARQPDRRGWEWYYLNRLCDPMVITLGTRKNPVLATTWSSDGRHVAGSSSNIVTIWEVDSRRELTRFIGHSDEVLAIAWSPDGKNLASSAKDRTLKLWNADTGEEAAAWDTEHAYPHLAWSPDGKRLASAKEGVIKVWDLGGKPVWTAPANVWGLAWHPDSTRIARVGDQNEVEIWDANTGRQLAFWQPAGRGGYFRAVGWSPNGRHLAVGGSDFGVRILDASTGEVLSRFFGHVGAVEKISWSADGQYLATTGRDDGAVKIWDATNWQLKTSYRRHLSAVRSLAWHPSANRVASGSLDGTIKLWDLNQEYGPVRRLRQGGQVMSVTWNRDGRLASGANDGFIRVWDATLTTSNRWSAINRVAAVAWNSAQTHLAAGTGDGSVKLCNATTGEIAWSSAAFTNEVRALAWSADGQQLAVTGLADQLVIMDLNGAVKRSYKLNTWGAFTVAWSPDGKIIAVPGADDSVRILDVDSGTEIRTLRGHRALLRSVAWSPDGLKIASAGQDGTAKIWDAASGTELHTLAGHGAAVYSVAWNFDGSRVATGSWDRTAKVWNPNTGQLLCSLEEPREEITCVAWSADGQQLAVSTLHNSVFVYQSATRESTK